MLLSNKKVIVNSKGEHERLNIYSTPSECKLEGEPHKIIKIGNTTGYIGLTPDLDTPKASSKRVQIGNKVYAERKYLGKDTFYNYMQSKYPSSYKTITKITSDMFNEDTSDSESVSSFFKGMSNLESDIQLDTRNCKYFNSVYEECINLKSVSFLNTSKAELMSKMYRSCNKVEEFPLLDTSNVTDFSVMYGNCHSAKTFPQINTRNGISFSYMYGNCNGATSFPQLDTRNGKNFSGMYNRCSNATTLPQIDTKKGTIFEHMYSECLKATKVSDIDLSSITTEDITTNNKFSNMFYKCDSLTSVTFNNVPVGITVEQMRTATSAPSTCEIILNHRSE